MEDSKTKTAAYYETKKSFVAVTIALLWATLIGAINLVPNAIASGGPGGGGGGGGGVGGGAGGGLSSIANVLRGSWESLVVDTVLTVTFNNNGTFTATIQSPYGGISTDSGIWTLSPAVAPSVFSNPQGPLVLIDGQGALLPSGDVLLINKDQLFMSSPTGSSVSSITFVPQLVLSKLTI